MMISQKIYKLNLLIPILIIFFVPIHSVAENINSYNLKETIHKANQGDPESQYNLGILYQLGNDLQQNLKEASNWYKKAAEQGFVYAQYNLGVLYAEGDGVPLNIKEAIKWYKKAAEQGLDIAQFNLGLIYDSGKVIPPNKYEAFKWYQKAAEQGQPNAQYNLGCLYLTGEGTEEDYLQALNWIKKAAEQGHAGARSVINAINEERSIGDISSQNTVTNELNNDVPIFYPSIKTLLLENGFNVLNIKPAGWLKLSNRHHILYFEISILGNKFIEPFDSVIFVSFEPPYAYSFLDKKSEVIEYKKFLKMKDNDKRKYIKEQFNKWFDFSYDFTESGISKEIASKKEAIFKNILDDNFVSALQFTEELLDLASQMEYQNDVFLSDIHMIYATILEKTFYIEDAPETLISINIKKALDSINKSLEFADESKFTAYEKYSYFYFKGETALYLKDFKFAGENLRNAMIAYYQNKGIFSVDPLRLGGTHQILGLLCVNSGNRKGALTYFKKAIEIYMKNGNSGEIENCNLMIESLKQPSTEQFENEYSIIISDARYLTKKGDLKEAIKLYSKAIQYKSKGVDFMNRGKVYAALGELEKAINDFKKAKSLDPRLKIKANRLIKQSSTVIATDSFNGKRTHAPLLFMEREYKLVENKKNNNINNAQSALESILLNNGISVDGILDNARRHKRRTYRSNIIAQISKVGQCNKFICYVKVLFIECETFEYGGRIRYKNDIRYYKELTLVSDNFQESWNLQWKDL